MYISTIHGSHQIMHLKRMENKSRSYLLLAAAPCCTVQWTVQHPSTVALLTKVNSVFFFLKNQWTVRVNFNSLALYMNICFSKNQLIVFFLEKPVQLIDFTRIVHVNVNSNFYFKKKISLRWIKFIRTVISIWFLIIFYLILLHVQKIMEIVVLVRWILYVIEL
jgi:hypothetical protein